MAKFRAPKAVLVSYIIKGRSPAASARLLALPEGEVACVSAITEAEIRYGLAKRPEATALKHLMDAFLASIQVLPWGRDEAESYGRLRARLEQGGKSLGNMDLMIAAHAVVLGALLVTKDKAFAQVEELRATTDWASDAQG